jgi:hypothetical protein
VIYEVRNSKASWTGPQWQANKYIGQVGHTAFLFGFYRLTPMGTGGIPKVILRDENHRSGRNSERPHLNKTQERRAGKRKQDASS